MEDGHLSLILEVIVVETTAHISWINLSARLFNVRVGERKIVIINISLLL